MAPKRKRTGKSRNSRRSRSRRSTRSSKKSKKVEIPKYSSSKNKYVFKNGSTAAVTKFSNGRYAVKKSNGQMLLITDKMGSKVKRR